MKSLTSIIMSSLLVFFTFSASASPQLKIFVEGKETKNIDGYMIKDNKLYISEDALKKDFGFAISYDKAANKYMLYDSEKIAYKARCEMFEEYGNIYNPKNSDEAASLWAQGVKERNGVFQYLTLSKALREEFRKSMDAAGRNSWVTGFSSPWIVDYKIVKENIDESTFSYKITFKAVTSAPDTYTWHAAITVSKEDNKWRIIKINKDFDII